jgi:hypothetical protein
VGNEHIFNVALLYMENQCYFQYHFPVLSGNKQFFLFWPKTTYNLNSCEYCNLIGSSTWSNISYTLHLINLGWYCDVTNIFIRQWQILGVGNEHIFNVALLYMENQCYFQYHFPVLSKSCVCCNFWVFFLIFDTCFLLSATQVKRRRKSLKKYFESQRFLMVSRVRETNNFFYFGLKQHII